LAATPGVVSTEVGYTGGQTPHPSYEQVCSGTTGHAEAVKVTFDEKRTSYHQLVRHFLETQRPIADLSGIRGGQYRSAIFYLTPQQDKEARQTIRDFEKDSGCHVATQVEPARTFWKAEEYHQHYYKKHGGGSCSIP